MNIFESTNRERRANRLVSALSALAKQFGTTEAVLVRHLTEKQWERLAAAAEPERKRPRVPSEKTIARVKKLVAEREKDGDPFARFAEVVS